MELLALLLGLFVLVTLFMPWINHSRFGSVRSEIERLKTTVKYLEDQLYGSQSVKQDVKTESAVMRDAPVQKEVPAQKEVNNDNYSKDYNDNDAIKEPEEKPKSSVPLSSDKDWVKTAQESFEQNIATKLPVWIGAISLIFAAFFLVKYSMELGWMKPIVRVSLGGLFGISLVVIGQWVTKRPHIANSERISQGLVGAGLVALYVSIYAALNLYSLLPAIFGFGAMAAVTAFAVILSLRHGQPIAIFGLLGGLLTPALIGSDEPNALAMFSYLFLLFTGMFAVLVRKGWWILAIAAVIGVFSWSAFWFLLVFSASDAIVLVIFAIAISAVVLTVTGKRIAEDRVEKEDRMPFHSLNFAAIVGGVVTIAWLSFVVTLTLFDWSMLGLLSVAILVLAYFQPHIYQRPVWVKLAASLILYFMWAQDAPLSDSIAVLFGIAVVYVAYKTACKAQMLVKQNFILAVIYNLIAIPLAVAGFVTPFIAALAMSGSSLIVIANSFRLKLSA
ncbi:MAG: DUF2339 domain-containing protein [Bdellovibrionales bacterium]